MKQGGQLRSFDGSEQAFEVGGVPPVPARGRGLSLVRSGTHPKVPMWGLARATVAVLPDMSAEDVKS